MTINKTTTKNINNRLCRQVGNPTYNSTHSRLQAGHPLVAVVASIIYLVIYLVRPYQEKLRIRPRTRVELLKKQSRG